jgi:hypothetical protein
VPPGARNAAQDDSGRFLTDRERLATRLAAIQANGASAAEQVDAILEGHRQLDREKGYATLTVREREPLVLLLPGDSTAITIADDDRTSHSYPGLTDIQRATMAARLRIITLALEQDTP